MLRFCCFIVILIVPLPCHAVLSDWQAADAFYKADYQRARELYEQAVMHDPNDSRALYNVGQAAYNQKDYPAAQQCFAKVIEGKLANEELEQAHFMLGDTFAQMGKYEQALQQYAQVLEINAENSFAKKRIEYIRKLLEDQKKQEKQKKQEQEKNNEDQKQNSDPQKKSDGKQNDADEQPRNAGQKDQGNKQGQQGNDSDKQSQAKNQEKAEQHDGTDSRDESEGGAKKDAKQQGDHSQQAEQHQQHTNPSNNNRQQEQLPSDKDTANGSKEQGHQAATSQERELENEEKLDKREIALLQALEKADAQACKDLVQARIKNSTVKEYGHKNW